MTSPHSKTHVCSWLPRLHDVGATATLGPLLDQDARDPLPEDFFDFLGVLGTGNYGKVLDVDLMMMMMDVMNNVEICLSTACNLKQSFVLRESVEDEHTKTSNFKWSRCTGTHTSTLARGHAHTRKLCTHRNVQHIWPDRMSVPDVSS